MMPLLLLFYRFFAWMFVNPTYRIKDPSKIKVGNFVVIYNELDKKMRVWMAASTVKKELLLKRPLEIFYAIDFGDWDMTHYPTPDSHFVNDCGMRENPAGSNTAYLLPVSASPKQVESLIKQVKVKWPGLVRALNTGTDSPFI